MHIFYKQANKENQNATKKIQERRKTNNVAARKGGLVVSSEKLNVGVSHRERRRHLHSEIMSKNCF